MTLNCSICNSLRITFISKWNYSHIACLACGHVSLFPLLNNFESAELHRCNYSYAFKDTDYVSELPKPTWFELLDLNEPKSFLDVGCADGRLLNYLKIKGMRNLVGLEVNDRLAAIGRNNGLKIVTGNLNEVEFDDSSFDYVHLGDVLEHLPETDDALIQLKKFLNKDGILIITTPNLHSIWSKITLFIHKKLNIPWSSLTPPHHVNNYTLTSLKILLERNGFEILRVFHSRHSFIYELSSLRLRREFVESPSFRSMLRMLNGYSCYFIAQLLYWLLILKGGHKFKMTLACRLLS